MLLAVKYCHDNSISHRDLKCENFLYSSGRIYLADFGMATKMTAGKFLTKQCGSLAYTAPEIVKKKPYSGVAVDIWSLGVILYCMICHGFPFHAEDPEQLREKIVHQPLQFPASISPEARDLIKRMLCRSPQKRISWEEIFSHPFFRQDEVEPADLMDLAK